MGAMDKINVKGLICLEAGTGAGNMTRCIKPLHFDSLTANAK